MSHLPLHKPVCGRVGVILCILNSREISDAPELLNSSKKCLSWSNLSPEWLNYHFCCRHVCYSSSILYLRISPFFLLNLLLGIVPAQSGFTLNASCCVMSVLRSLNDSQVSRWGSPVICIPAFSVREPDATYSNTFLPHRVHRMMFSPFICTAELKNWTTRILHPGSSIYSSTYCAHVSPPPSSPSESKGCDLFQWFRLPVRVFLWLIRQCVMLQTYCSSYLQPNEPCLNLLEV